MLWIYKCPTKISVAFPQIWGAKNIKFWITFFAISGTKRRIDKQKYYCQSTIRPLHVDLLSVTFHPETAEIRLLIVSHPSAAITLQPLKLRHLNFCV